MLIFVLLLSSSGLQAQRTIEGRVIDASDGNGIPFVHIVPLGQGSRGTQSDLEGDFSLKLPRASEHLVVSSVGYEKDTVSIPERGHLLIELEEKAVEKKAIEVIPGKNPALAIIRKAIAQRKEHDPLRQKAFSYRSYSKIIYSDRSLSFDSSWAEKEKLDTGRTDTALASIPDSIHAFLMETVTERHYVKGRYDKKKVTGARVSGFQDPPFTAVASELQGISFYRNYVELLGEEYRSPISKGALNKYEYRLRNELVEDGDTTFFIGFRPEPAQQLQALKGMIAIGSDGYAIRSVRASPVKQGPNPVRVEQLYRKIAGASFPLRMNFELRLPALGTVYNGKSYLREVCTGEGAIGEVGRKDLSIEKMEGFGERDSGFWEKARAEPLSKKDSNTYKLLDSLGREHNFDRMIEVTEKLVRGRFPLGPIDLRLYELYRYNAFEKNRLGIGLESNEKLSPFFRLGGYWGYGTGDGRMKYGADIEVRPTGDREWRMGVYYRKDLVESARYSSPRGDRFLGSSTPFSASAQRELYMRRFLASEEMGFRFRTSRPRYLTLGLWARKSRERPLFSTPYMDRFPSFQDLELAETAFRFRFAYGEERMMSFGQKMSIETPYPVLHGKLVKGWEGKGFGGERSYWRVFGRLEHDFPVRGLGQGSFTLDIGGSFGDPPLSRLTYAPGTYSRDIPLFVPRSFNTAGRYDYLHSRFVHLFFDQGLFRFTLIEDHSRPLFRLRHHMGWGDRKGFEGLSLNEVGTMAKGYYESGVTVEDLIYTEVDRLYTYGLGISAAYRYGPYASSSTWGDLAYGIEFSLGF